jgi:SAM-dependent methyltransferase
MAKNLGRTLFWNPSADGEPSVEICELAAAYPFRAVLDAGCGTGRNLVPFDKPGASLYGLDLDEKAVSAARLRLRNGQSDSTCIERVDLRDYEPDCQFDLVICHGVLHFLRRAERLAVYNRIKSWTAPNGCISIVMFNARVPIPQDLRHLMPEPPEDSDELLDAFLGWIHLSFRSYVYNDEHHEGRIKHTHSIDRLIVRSPK